MVCGLVAWLVALAVWACVVRLVVPVRLRARVCESEETRVFTAWVRRKPVVVTARAGGQSPVVLWFYRLPRAAVRAWPAAPLRAAGGWVPGWGWSRDAMQRPPRAGQDPARNGGTRRDGIARRFGAGGVVNATRAPWYGAVAAGKCGGRVGDSGLGSVPCPWPRPRVRGQHRHRPRPGRRLFIWLVSSRPIGETTEGITCFSPRGRGKWPFSRAAGDTGRPGASVEPKIRSASAAAADRRDAWRAPPSTASTRTYARVVTPIQ